MNEFIKLFRERIADFSYIDAIDLLLLAGVFFLIYRFIRRRRAFPILIGVLGFLVLSVIARVTPLSGVSYATEAIMSCGVVVLAIVFQPELRAALEKSGDAVLSFLKRLAGDKSQVYSEYNAIKVKKAVLDLSDTHTGAIIVLERNAGIDDIAKDGVKLDALISTELIKNIFASAGPLHDGAVIIRDGRIHAAACYVVVNSEYIPVKAYGARHNAGRAVSVSSDSTVIIVSEENGAVSLARNGDIMFNVNARELENVLFSYFPAKNQKATEKRQIACLDEAPTMRDESADDGGKMTTVWSCRPKEKDAAGNKSDTDKANATESGTHKKSETDKK